MKNLIISTLSVLYFLSAACSTGAGSGSEKDVASDENEVSSAGCLLLYKEKLDGLLTPEKAAGTAGKPAEEAQQKYSRVMKNTSYHSVRYVWKSGRQKTVNVMGRQMTVPVNDIVELHGLKEVTLDYFQKSHRPPTKEQLEASQNEIDKAIDGKSDNEKVNENLKKLDEMKVSKETQKATTGTLNSAFAEAAKSYSNVTGIGEVAAWNSFENRLYIYEKGIEMSVTVDLSNDSEVNRRKAIELGKVLLKCD